MPNESASLRFTFTKVDKDILKIVLDEPNNVTPVSYTHLDVYKRQEYAHAMGNSTGYYKKYWDIFREQPQAQGGFMWDWADQTPLWDLPTAEEGTGFLDQASDLRNTYTGTLEKTGDRPDVNNVLRGSAIFDNTPYLNFYTGNTEMADGVVVGKTLSLIHI